MKLSEKMQINLPIKQNFKIILNKNHFFFGGFGKNV